MSILEHGCCAIDDILRETFGIQIVDKALDPLSDKDFVKISSILGKKLNGIATELQGPAIARALNTLDVDWKKLSDSAKSAVIREANKQMLFPSSKIGPAIHAEMTIAGMNTGKAAKESAIEKFKLTIGSNFNAEDKKVQQFALNSQANFITDRLGQLVGAHSEKARQIVSEGVAAGLGRQEIGQKLHALFSGLENGRTNKAYFETVAGSFINRSRTFASVAAFQQAGVAFYVWESILDEVTTDTCRFFHGKRFPVNGAMAKIEQVGSAKSPDDVKQLQPWVREGLDGEGNKVIFAGKGSEKEVLATIKESGVGTADKIGEYVSKLNDAQLVDRGFSLPPIHGMCRSTVLSDVSSVGPAVAVPSGPMPPPPKLTPEQMQGQALKNLAKLSASPWGDGKVHKWPIDESPSYTDEWSNTQILKMAEDGAGSILKPKREDVFFPMDTFDDAKAAALIKDPAKLKEEIKDILMVKHQGRIYLVNGIDAAAAQRLLGLRRVEGRLIDLDKMAKPKPAVPLVRPTAAKPDAPVAITLPPHENILHEKTGNARGSNEGGFYRGKDGVNRYVKFYKDPTQAHSEHLTNKIYKDLGLEAPNSQVFKMPDGRYAYASDLYEGGKVLGAVANQIEHAKDAMNGFVADVFVGNWDAAGLSLDNMMVLSNGKLARIDNGGALLFRAQAGRKPEGALGSISEWQKFFDGTNPSYANLAKMANFDPIESRKMIVKQIDDVVAMHKREGGWQKFVDRIVPDMTPADKAKVIDMLEKRTELLVAKQKELKAYKPPKPPKPGEAKWIEKPVGGVKPRKGLDFKDLPERPLPSEYRKLPADRLQDGEKIVDYRARLEKGLSALTRQERAAIEGFTNGTYGRVRETEESGTPNRDAQLIKSGLEKLPNEPRTVYRGISGLENHMKDDFLTNSVIALGKGNVGASTSMSWSPNVSVDWNSSQTDGYRDTFKVLYRINGKTCKGVEPISRHTHERELMFSVDARFRVTGLSRVEGTERVVMIEAEEIVGKELKAILEAERKMKKNLAKAEGRFWPVPYIVEGGKVVVIRGLEIDDGFPDEVIVSDAQVTDGGPVSGRVVKLEDVPTLTREDLCNTFVDHPVRGLHRPWRNVYGVGW